MVQINYCLVKQNVGALIEDSPGDYDRYPDYKEVTGEVVFTPMIAAGQSFQLKGSDGEMYTVPITRIRGKIVEGKIWHEDEEGVPLFAGGEGANPSSVSYRVTYSGLRAGINPVQLNPIAFTAIPGETIDLTTVTPISNAPVSGVIKGDKGEPGVDGKDGEVTLEQLNESLWLQPPVPSGTDLDTITSPGVRLLLFSTQPNKPFAGAGVLEVLPIVGGGTLQRITDYVTLEVWKRKTQGGVFQPWEMELSKADLDTKTDKSYVDSVKWLQPPVPSGTDLDTLTTPCVRILLAGDQPNKPFSGSGFIEVLPIVGGGSVQRATSHSPFRVWKRRTVAGTFGSWSVEPTNSDLDSKADKSYVDTKVDKSYVDSVTWLQPRVPAGTDLDTLTTPCVRILPTGLLPNKPFNNHGFIEVMPAISGGTLQRATDYENLKVWTRKTSGGVFQAWEEANPTWLRPHVASGTDLDTITSPGVRLLLFSTQPNKPFAGAGVLEVLPIVGGGTLQRITDYVTLEVWKRKTSSGVFQPWEKEPTNETVTQTITETIDNHPALTQDWTKTYPLMVTTGSGASNFSPFGDYRVRIQFTAPILRWRLHISTTHPYSSTHKSAADLSDVRIGLGLGDGEMEDGEVLLGTNTTIEEGGEWVSDWSRYDLRQDSLLALTVSRHGTYSDCLLAGWVKQNGTWVRKQHIPIWIWIEAETYSATPSVALIGDSTGSGQGSIEPVWDSAVVIAGRKQEFLPVLYAASGDNLANYTNPNRIILKRWEHFSRADSVVIQSGSNDIHGGNSLERVKTSFERVQPIARKLGVKVYAATIKPRYPAGNMEDVRIPYNEWLKTLPFGIDGVIDYDGAVAPDGAILPEDNADGAHLTKSGHMKMASAYSYPIARPRVTETWRP